MGKKKNNFQNTEEVNEVEALQEVVVEKQKKEVKIYTPKAVVKTTGITVERAQKLKSFSKK